MLRVTIVVEIAIAFIFPKFIVMFCAIHICLGQVELKFRCFVLVSFYVMAFLFLIESLLHELYWLPKLSLTQSMVDFCDLIFDDILLCINVNSPELS